MFDRCPSLRDTGLGVMGIGQAGLGGRDIGKGEGGNGVRDMRPGMGSGG